MKQVFRIDGQGFYIEPVILNDNEPCPSDCREDKPQDGLYKIKRNSQDTGWEEGLTQPEIDNIRNIPNPPDPIEDLKKQQADLVFQLMLNGVI